MPELLRPGVTGQVAFRFLPTGSEVMVSWALDIALRTGGFDALHPGGKGTLEQLGHDHGL